MITYSTRGGSRDLVPVFSPPQICPLRDLVPVFSQAHIVLCRGGQRVLGVPVIVDS